MGTAYLDVCISPTHRGVTLFQAECIAEVEYQVDHGELAGWHVSNLKFQEIRSEWDDMARKWTRKIVAETSCPKDLLAPLIDRLDSSEIEEKLFDCLRDTGEIVPQIAAQRADYHARVL